MDKKQRLLLSGCLIVVLAGVAVWIVWPSSSQVDASLLEKAKAAAADPAQQPPPEQPYKSDFKPRGFAPH